MNILAIDPGATTGWVAYDSEAGRVLAAGHFREHRLDIPHATPDWPIDLCVIERPRGYGPTRPQMVECGIVFGRLVEHLERLGAPVHEMLRMDICRILTDATYGQIRVRNDATAWAAVLHLHGGPDAAAKGGSLCGVKSHARAALAAAVAACLQLDEDRKSTEEQVST